MLVKRQVFAIASLGLKGFGALGSLRVCTQLFSLLGVSKG